MKNAFSKYLQLSLGRHTLAFMYVCVWNIKKKQNSCFGSSQYK